MTDTITSETANRWENATQLAWRIRRHAVDMVNRAKTSHIGSIFSIADIVAVLYDSILSVDPLNPSDPARDRFVLSKGHAGCALYAALAEMQFFSTEELKKYCINGSLLSGHISHKGIPGIELSTGSLGHGLSVATGMALSAKKRKSAHRAFVLMSDGECDEGSNWEAFLFAAHHRLDNLIAIVDYNKLQSLRSVNDTLRLEPLRDKLMACNWAVEEIDGHDHAALAQRLSRVPFEAGKPSLLIAHTTKGRGVSFMENSVLWHYRTPQGDEYAAAVAELEKARPRP
ncbi:transketolase [Nitrobacter vulgaris]|uniref:Transketolase n=1 Tax=Nitrobacter vulgaris TaxID=29421 RepID=A0A1V4HVY4_NITVU|nr:transketolase [Nitrobacter vulgaris]OPH82073.1 transketolase [Nitrobacter vulgaris]